jgi:uncharacterized protein (DUF885 family)
MNMRSLILIPLLFAAVYAGAAEQKPKCAMFAKFAASGTPSQKLNRFFDGMWKYVMTEHPEFATYVGYPGQNDRWTDNSLEAIARRKAEARCALKTLKTIPRNALKGQERVSYDLLVHRYELGIEGDQFPDEFMPINQRDGVQLDAVQMLTAMPTASVADYENMIKRLDKLPTVVAQTEILMREGMKAKVTPVKAFMEKVIPQIDQLTVADVEKSPFYSQFKEMNVAIPAADQARLREAAKKTITEKVYPAFTKLKEFLVKEYNPVAREFIAFSDMPNGKAWYAYRVKAFTTTNMTPDQLHQLGLNEVERIRKEMNAVKEEVKFKGDLKAFNKFLLTDKRFHYKTAEELLSGYRDIAKRVDAELPKLFKTLPRMTYGVRAIPDYAAPTAAGAQYIGGSLEAGRAGFFEANTYDLASRPKWDMETLTFHEAVPGHHFQIARAKELPEMPEFRKNGGFTAYSEGWALYAESLGYELGFFKDPYSKYGNLSAEMMRAARLVVDTGMHSKGWSKEKALEFYRAAFPTTDVDSNSEIERYISWPAQALAYKVGQLKFRELREMSKAELGPAFDVREFHDEVLNYGALPMDVLEKTVREWVAKQKKKAKVRQV